MQKRLPELQVRDSELTTIDCEAMPWTSAENSLTSGICKDVHKLQLIVSDLR
jgi:hypothetical protein